MSPCWTGSVLPMSATSALAGSLSVWYEMGHLHFWCVVEFLLDLFCTWWCLQRKRHSSAARHRSWLTTGTWTVLPGDQKLRLKLSPKPWFLHSADATSPGLVQVSWPVLGTELTHLEACCVLREKFWKPWFRELPTIQYVIDMIWCSCIIYYHTGIKM